MDTFNPLRVDIILFFLSRYLISDINSSAHLDVLGHIGIFSSMANKEDTSVKNLNMS